MNVAMLNAIMLHGHLDIIHNNIQCNDNQHYHTHNRGLEFNEDTQHRDNSKLHAYKLNVIMMSIMYAYCYVDCCVALTQCFEFCYAESPNS
jgi:hypothetical protein